MFYYFILNFYFLIKVFGLNIALGNGNFDFILIICLALIMRILILLSSFFVIFFGNNFIIRTKYYFILIHYFTIIKSLVSIIFHFITFN